VTRRASTCPNCSAPVEFAWSSAVQTTCAHCRSVVVRHDVDLKAIGEISDLPDDSSPVQIGVEGAVDGRSFRVVGRIVYEFDDGGWNEWHLVFSDNSSGWLSDAQAEYAVSQLVTPAPALPAMADVQVGRDLSHDGADLTITTITVARYKGVEGELPFEYWGRGDVTFVDLRSGDGRFGTIDYSETPPLLFVGKFMDYDALSLRGVRAFPGW
jgi:hypothetical protein